jgi:Uncharacterised nucleotidyltransferase
LTKQAIMTERAGALMLAMLAPARVIHADDFAAMEDQDWLRLNAIAHEQRMVPMLRYRDNQSGQHWPLPDFVRESWQAGYRRSALRALEFERALHQIAAVMAGANIPFVALKGSWLAWHAYPHPALRPMRDIDMWVPQDQALASHAALIGAGCTAITHGFETAEALVGDAKTLPPLWSVSGTIMIELHMHLSHHHGPAGEELDHHHPPENLLPDSIAGQLRGHPIRYLSPTDTLLHLIVHSAYDHGFNNGPAIFDDIAFTVASHAIDWSRFWTRAGKQGWIKGAVLLLALTVRQIGPLPIDWQGHAADAVPEPVLATVLPLTLQSAEDRATIAFLAAAEAEQATTGRRRWLDKLTVSQARLAMFLGVASDSPLAWLAYPLWLGSGIWRIARGTLDGDIRLAGQRRAVVAHWLDLSSQSRRR